MKTPIVMLTCRLKDSDFRYPLACEFAALGHPVTHIFLNRRPVMTDVASGRTTMLSLPALFRLFFGFRLRQLRPIVFNSTDLAFPLISIVLRMISGTTWCLDIHDPLLYDSVGFDRWTKGLALSALLSNSDIVVHASPALGELYPGSIHIGNASSVEALPKVRCDESVVLILASLDDRFDFDLLDRVAGSLPERRFEIFGRIHRNKAAVEATLRQITQAHRNVSYMGPYSDTMLPQLLSRYVVTFAPYKVDRTTALIDPLRFYHCTAANVGVVSTAIPQAVVLRDWIEVVGEGDDVEGALRRAVINRRGPIRTWRQVAEQLQGVFERLRPAA